MIANLQALRAVAAMMVVLHHTRIMLQPYFPGLDTLRIGAAGVDIFFILSGVVISLSFAQNHMSARTFLWHRIVRVVPMWWVALGLLFAMLLAGLSPLGVQQSDATLINALKSMFFIPFERSHGGIMPLIGVGWTLNYEMAFYLLFAGLMVLAPILTVSFAVIAALCVLSIIGWLLAPNNLYAAFYTNPILLEFAAGVLLARLWLATSANGRWADLSVPAWTGWGLLVASVAGFAVAARPELQPEDMPDRALVWGLPAMACVAGAMILERVGQRLASSQWMFFGATSYVLYLFHLFVLQLAAKLGSELALGPAAILVVAFGAVIASQLVAIGLHKGIELPLTRWLKRRTPQNASPPISAK